MGLLFNLSLLVCISLVESRGLLAPQKAPAKNATVAKATDDDEDEMMPPMEAFEGVDSDVDADADSAELEAEEEQLHSHHPGRMFGLHKEGEKDTSGDQHHHDSVDPMDALHNHRLGSLGETPKPRAKKAAPVQAKKAPAPTSHLNHLKDLVGADEETPKPAAKPAEEKKPVVQEVSKPLVNKTEVAVSAETVAQVEKMKKAREAEKAAAKAPKVVAPKAAPKKAHNLGKDLEAVSGSEMAPLDPQALAKLKAAMPSPKKPSPPAQVVHEHEHGDALGRLHAHAQKAKETTVTHTTTVSVAPRERKASPQQLAAARRASALTDALRNVNASDVQLKLDVSEEAAKKIQSIDTMKRVEAEKIEKATTVDHMVDLKATAEKELAKKVNHLEAKKAAKQEAKPERPLSKLAEALGMDKEVEATTTTTVAPVKVTGADPIKALHQRLHQVETKKVTVQKPKVAPQPVQQKKTEESDEGIISGFHHNKARDTLPPVLR